MFSTYCSVTKFGNSPLGRENVCSAKCLIMKKNNGKLYYVRTKKPCEIFSMVNTKHTSKLSLPFSEKKQIPSDLVTKNRRKIRGELIAYFP